MTAASVAESWTLQPLILVPAVILVLGYLRAARRVAGGWPARSTSAFTVGMLGAVVLSCGPAAHYGDRLYWIWVSQYLALLLVLPILIMAGRPVELAIATAPQSWLSRVLQSRLAAGLTSPLLGPGLVPVVCVAMFFGPVPGWSVQHPAIDWLLQLVVLLVGCLVAYPLVSTPETATSLAVAAAVAVGVLELLVDAVPGLVLRLATHPVSTFFDHRLPMAGQPSALHDQQIGGGILWCVAELLDLPFLILVFRRWVHVDAREAAAVDARLDAETSEIARTNNGRTTDEPWFLSDPRLKDRLK